MTSGGTQFRRPDSWSAAPAKGAALDHPPDLHLCLTKAEVAELCGIEESVVPDWVRKGIIPGPIPGTRRWNRDHLREHLLNRSKGVQDGRPRGDDDWSV